MFKFLKEKKEKESMRLIPLGIIIGALFIFSYSDAGAQTVHFQQPNNATTTGQVGSSYQYLGNLTSGKVINSIQLSGRSNVQDCTGNCQPLLSVCFNGTYNHSNGVCSSSSEGSITITYATTTNPSGTTFYTGTLTATTTNSNHDYRIAFQSGASFGLDYVAGSNNASSYANGEYVKFSGGSYVNDFNVLDAYFRIGQDISSSSSGNSIAIVDPINGETTPAFSHWRVSYIISSFYSLNNLYLEINWGTTTSSMTRRDGGDVPQYYATSSQSILVDYTFELTDYYAQAFIKTGTTTIATSTIIQFTATSAGNPFDNQPAIVGGYSTTTDPFDFFTRCNESDTNFWSSSVCNFLTLLFKPSAGSVDMVVDAFGQFRNVFPFSVFFSIQTIQQYAIDQNTGQSGSNLSVDIMGRYGSDITLLTPNLLESLVGSNVKNFLFTLVTALVWVSVMYRIGKHFV